MIAAEDIAAEDRGVPARSETDHSATPAHGLTAVPPQPSQTALPAAFRRALAAAAPKGVAAPPSPKSARPIAGQATATKPGAPKGGALRHKNTGPRCGHK